MTKLPINRGDREVILASKNLDHVQAVALELLWSRGAGATVCPSEVARAVSRNEASGSAASWRSVMPSVHAAIDDLLVKRLVRLSWKGKPLERRNGPYRIGHPVIDSSQDC